MTVTDENLAARRRRGTGNDPTQRVRQAGGTRHRSPAAERALQRRRKRLGAESVSSTSRHWQRAEKPATPVEKPALWSRIVAPVRALRRVPFAVVVVGMLLAGLVLTLWLSTKSAQDSYQLGVQRAYNEELSDRRDALMKTYESGDSAPELSEKAGELGMIPANDKARMVVGPDGRETIIGEVKPAEGVKAPSLNAAPKPPAPSRNTDDNPVAAPTAPGVQGIPIQGTPVTPNGNNVVPGAAVPDAAVPEAVAPTPSPTPGSAPAAPVAPATPPAYTNVLPSTGGAPGPNSAADRNTPDN